MFFIVLIESTGNWCEMSNVKVDVQWSPVDDDMFITYGTAINLYQAKERDGIFEASNSGTLISISFGYLWYSWHASYFVHRDVWYYAFCCLVSYCVYRLYILGISTVGIYNFSLDSLKIYVFYMLFSMWWCYDHVMNCSDLCCNFCFWWIVKDFKRCLIVDDFNARSE